MGENRMTGKLESIAKEIATRAHQGQLDKADQSYITHPEFVAGQVTGDEAKAVAWLHDVVEDTNITFDDLRAAGLSEAVIEAVNAITKRDNEDYETYLERVATNPLAKAVKLADLTHNMDTSRLKIVDDKTRARLEKYKVAFAKLSQS
jgi:(p)ppGpp synthase/HD superfamily hydrolase